MINTIPPIIPAVTDSSSTATPAATATIGAT